MNHIKNFDIRLDKSRILNSLDCYPNNHLYNETEEDYYEIEKIIKDIAAPEAIFDIISSENSPITSKENNYTHYVMVVTTLGNQITKQIDTYFEQGDFLKGMLLDAAASNLLFNISDDLYEAIKKVSKENNLGLSRRKSPGDPGFPMSYQKDILETLKGDKIDLGITEGFMLNPQKSSAYFYGASKDLSTPEKEHYCPHCDSANCKLRQAPSSQGEINIKVIDSSSIRVIKALKSKSLYETLQKNNIFTTSPCNGNGTCGKCRVTVKEGTVYRNSNNYKHLNEEETKKGICLSCSTYPLTDLTIEVKSTKEDDFEILASCDMDNIEINPHVYTQDIQIIEENLKSTSLQSFINGNLNGTFVFSLDSLKKLSTSINKSSINQDIDSLYDKKNLKLVIKDNKVLDVCSRDNTSLYALGVDIGTTTIVMSIVDLTAGKIIDNYSIINSQRQYGADVISRINHSITDLKTLTECIQNDLLNGIKSLLNKTGIKAKNIYHMAIAGNTTMIHLLCGLYSDSLALYPFNTTTLSQLEFSFYELFSSDTLNCDVTILPSISTYVGADISSGILKCNFNEAENISLLIDIGTNGEMVIGNKDKLLCLATAAGPAFEGANISCGTGSIPGAISKVKIENNEVAYTTIGNKPPIGICGSAIIDITAECMKAELIDETGRFIDMDFLSIVNDDDYTPISFTQKDIREVQLAKSAIRSGIEVLINNFGCNYSDIDTVFIAGGFGNHINIENAASIGLIPSELKEKVKIIGNSSLGGIISYILDKNSSNVIKYILDKTDYIDISADENFNDLFIENMMFE